MIQSGLDLVILHRKKRNFQPGDTIIFYSSFSDSELFTGPSFSVLIHDIVNSPFKVSPWQIHLHIKPL